MNTNNHFRFPHTTNFLQQQLYSESKILYISHTLKTFSQSLIGIFVPIYIYNLPNKPAIHNFEPLDSILWVLIFYLVRSIFVLLLTSGLTNLIFGKLKFKLSIFLSNIAICISIIGMIFANYNFSYIFITAIALSIDVILYWIPFHLFFIRKANSSNGKFGKSYGMRLLLTKAASAIGPATGGFIILAFGFNYLLTVSLVLILISGTPILFGIHEHNHGKHNALQIFKKYISQKKYLPISTAFGAVALEDVVYTIFWPILLIGVTESFSGVGILTSTSIAISALLAFYVGKFIDKHGKRKIHFVGVLINSIIHISRLFILSIFGIFVVDVVDKINGSLYSIPFMTKTYNDAIDNKHDSEFIIYREIVMHLAIASGLFIIILILPLLPNWKFIFIFLAFISPLTYLINSNSINRN